MSQFQFGFKNHCGTLLERVSNIWVVSVVSLRDSVERLLKVVGIYLKLCLKHAETCFDLLNMIMTVSNRCLKLVESSLTPF